MSDGVSPVSQDQRNARRKLALITGLVAVVCACLYSRFAIGIETDSCFFLNAALNLAQGHGLVVNCRSDIALTQESYLTTWAPLFPALTAALTVAFRIPHVVGAALICCLSFVGLCVLVAQAAARWYGTRWGYMVGLLCASSEYLWNASTWIYSDALFSFLCASLIVLLAEAKRGTALMALGPLAAMAVYTRYIGIVWFVVLAATELRLLATRDPRAKHLLWGLVLGALLLTPLLYWNHLHTGTIVGRPRTGSHVGVSLYDSKPPISNATDLLRATTLMLVPSHALRLVCRISDQLRLPGQFIVVVLASLVCVAGLITAFVRWSRISPAVLFLALYPLSLIALRGYHTGIDPLTTPRFLAPMAPAIFLVLAHGAVWTLRSTRFPSRKVGLIVGICLISYWSVLCGTRIVRGDAQRSYARVGPALQWLRANVPARALIAGGEGVLGILAQTAEYNLVRVPCPAKDPRQTPWTSADLRRLHDTGRIVFALFVPVYDRQDQPSIPYVPDGYGETIGEILRGNSPHGTVIVNSPDVMVVRFNVP